MYADAIQEWQKSASFSPDVEWVGDMIIRDAKRILQLLEEIEQLTKIIEDLIPESKIASRRYDMVFSKNCLNRKFIIIYLAV